MQPIKNSTSTYKIALSLLFGAFLLGMAATIFLSSHRGSRVVDTDYYDNGLNYDRTRSGARNPGLYWTMSASLAGKDLLVRVSDEKGAPLAGGKLFFQQKRAGGEQRAPLHLAESAPGVFRGHWPVTARGELHGTLRFTKGEASASQKVVFFD